MRSAARVAICGGARVIPERGRLLVRPVDAAESFAGSRLVIPVEARERLTAHQVEVIAVGAFAECDPARSRAERKCERAHERELCAICSEYPLGFGRGVCCGAGRRVHPHPIVAGAWLLVRPRSTLAGPLPERAEFFIHQDDVLGIFNSAEPDNAETP